MAGAEAIDKLRDLRDLNIIPTEIYGSFSGTLGFMASELEDGKRFSEVLMEAVKKGFTEPDPNIDISGEDVAKKLLILARTAGFKVNMEDIQLFPFVKPDFLPIGPKDAPAKRRMLDEFIASEISSAEANNSVLRYVARLRSTSDGPKLLVGPEYLQLADPLAQLRGTSNKIILRADVYGDRYYSVEAPGAGLEVTAMNVRRDMLHQLNGRMLRI